MYDRPSIIERDALRALTIGGLLAVAVSAVPFTNFIFGYLGTLVHELGHTVTNWVFGYPSVPAFDFAHGGGVTMHQERSTTILLVVYGIFGLGLYHLRRNVAAVCVLAGSVVLYSLAAFTPFHEALQLLMGHGAELVFAGIFLYRALSGEKIRVAGERSAYAFAGLFLFLSDVRFALGLMTSHEKRVEYELAKGGGAWMDFSRLADEFLHAPLQSVAALFLVGCILAPATCLVVYLQRERIREGIALLLQPKT